MTAEQSTRSGNRTSGAFQHRTKLLEFAKWLAIIGAAHGGIAHVGIDAAQPLNVLFIASDDLRNDLGCYGHPIVKTPNLDRLANRSTIFDRAYCQQAVCNPSRASLLTGQRLDRLRLWSLPIHFRENSPTAVTLPQYFMRHGYVAQNVGKIFHNWLHKVQGDPDSWSTPAELHFANHGADQAKVDGAVPPNLAVDPKCECRDVPDEAYFDGRVAGRATEQLERLKHERKPFFLAVGFWKPHSPFNAPKRYWDLYRRSDIAMPINPAWPHDAPRIAWHDSREILGAGSNARQPTSDGVREMRHGYLANISYLDAQIGRILDTLDRLDLTRNTVIVFWSDHGYHLGEQTLFAKTSNYELDARVPLLIATPQSPHAGKHTTSLAELMDLYPTLAQLCNLPKPSNVDGVSLVPVLTDPNRAVRDYALTQHPRPAYYDREPSKTPTHMGYSIRSVTHRYTEWRDWATGLTTDRELYDHRDDPLETRNIAGQSDQGPVVVQHAMLLEKAHPIVRPGWSPPTL